MWNVITADVLLPWLLPLLPWLVVLQEGKEALVWCKSSCGNNMHKQCFDKWAASRRSSGQEVTCVYCRAPWHDAAVGAAGGQR